MCVCVCVCVCDLFKQQALFVRFSQQRLGFDPTAVYVTFGVDKVTKSRVSLQSASVFACHYHSTIDADFFFPISIFTLFLLEKQAGKGCKHSNKAILFRKMEVVAKKKVFKWTRHGIISWWAQKLLFFLVYKQNLSTVHITSYIASNMEEQFWNK